MNKGNFLEILRWASTNDPMIQSIFEDSAGNANYLSHGIQNELINIMSDEIREQISFMVRYNSFVFLFVKIRLLMLLFLLVR